MDLQAHFLFVWIGVGDRNKTINVVGCSRKWQVFTFAPYSAFTETNLQNMWKTFQKPLDILTNALYNFKMYHYGGIYPPRQN